MGWATEDRLRLSLLLDPKSPLFQRGAYVQLIMLTWWVRSPVNIRPGDRLPLGENSSWWDSPIEWGCKRGCKID
jgi:hypothetical protein